MNRSLGTTPSERYLASLCDDTFLNLWSYPNIFRDQGKQGTGDGKEVCDLLVICGNDVVIFSDKSCTFGNSGNLLTDWARWYRRAIAKSADQLFGALRWIQKHPDRLFLDGPCTQPFPLDTSHLEDCRFHLVVVALGAKERCRAEFGGSGSLMLDPSVRGSEHCDSECNPFVIGDIDPDRQYVHVFDDVTLDIVLKELDTISDFTRYVSLKEAFVRQGHLEFAEGEEDFLAAYVSTVSGDQGHQFPLPSGFDKLYVRDGTWTSHVQSGEYRRKQSANEKSYLWDDIINEFSKHTCNGTAIACSSSTIAEAEKGIRFMAKESRLDRRVLSHSLIDLVQSSSDSDMRMRTVISEQASDSAYVFLTAKNKVGSEEEYREFRRNYLDKYCFVLAWKKKFSRVVGIGTEDSQQSGRSYDLCVCEPSEWTNDMKREAETLQAKLNILRDENLTKRNFHDDEYPAAPVDQVVVERASENSPIFVARSVN